MPATRTSKRTTGKASAPTAAKSKAKKIPRPENSFILYRKDRALSYKEEHPELFPMKIGPLSKIIGLLWKEEPADVRLGYENLAAVKLAEHKVMYPGYKYHPTPKAQKEAKKKEAAARKARVEEAKAARAASRATSARAWSTAKTPSEAAGPVPGPSQVAVPRRKSRRTSAPSGTSTAGTSGAKTQGAAAPALPGTGMFALSPDSDAESRLSSATPSQEFDGETLRRLPFPLQATATAFVPTPTSDDVQYAAPSIQAPALDASFLPELVQGSSPQVPDGAFFPNPAMASPALSSGPDSDPLGLSRVWYGLPPRDIPDPAFPAHLPPAGLVEPIDLQDVVFALNNAQQTGVAWVAHPPQMVPDVAPSALNPVLDTYDYPPANESGALGPTMDMAEVHPAADQSAADASDAFTLEDALDHVAAEADTLWELPSMPLSMELVDFAVERFFATPGVPMEPSL
ncbi:Mating-type M-specific polypeptide Mc [Trametes pubescens]|uniref:Mating-type M-specific polypeptide Mc n=1 Tax=Trametes pubescens TaxID=154538 RepID=A0A1M2VA19_TRAPU|nr:Mating-type M-specific polypeptide Mc [Trametes pubescens]